MKPKRQIISFLALGIALSAGATWAAEVRESASSFRGRAMSQDINFDGSLSRTEVREFLKGQNPAMAVEAVTRLRQMDRKGDGTVSGREIARWQNQMEKAESRLGVSIK